MDARLLTLGIGLLVSSAALAAYALYSGAPGIAGALLSSSVFGAVLAVMGYTYRDPLSETALKYAEGLAGLALKIYEDMGLLGTESLRTCISDGRVLVVYSARRVSCEDVRPGLGLAGGSPYIALATEEAGGALGDPQQAISELGLASRVSVVREGSAFTVELAGVREELLSGGWRPMNLVQVAVLSRLSAAAGAPLERESEEFSDGVYRARFRVAGE